MFPLLGVAKADSVTVQPGVTFSLTGGYANVTFTSIQTFANLSFANAHTVCFDTPTACLSVEKQPAAYPDVLLTIAQWTPGVSYGVAFQWSLTVQTPPAGDPTAVWINFSQLSSYIFLAYAGSQLLNRNSGGGSISIALAPYALPANPMFLTIGSAGSGGGGGGGVPPPAPYPFTCASGTSFLFTLYVNCNITAPLPTDTVYTWYVNGTVACGTPTCSFLVKSLRFETRYFLIRLTAISKTYPLSSIDETQPIFVTTNGVSALGWGLILFLIVIGFLLFHAPRFPLPSHPEGYRANAIHVSFYPAKTNRPHYVSFRQLEKDFDKYILKHRRLYGQQSPIIYGIRNGRAHVQAVLEPIEKASREHIQRALASVQSVFGRDRIEEYLRKRGAL
jgi:hypothetical protein